jgi:hypothetical protein
MDAELGPEEKKVVEDHLANCPKCFQKAVRQGRTAQLLRSAAPSRDDTQQISNPAVSRLYTQLQQDTNVAKEVGPRRFQLNLSLVLSVVVVGFILIYGVQSLLRDVITRNAKASSGKVSTYVEDHLNFESTYRVTGEISSARPGMQP